MASSKKYDSAKAKEYRDAAKARRDARARETRGALDRISREISDRREALFGGAREVNPPTGEPEEDESDKSSTNARLRELCEELDINYSECFEVHETPESSRVTSIQFIPTSEQDAIDTMERMLSGGFRHRKGVEIEDLLTGTIKVFWKNNKPPQGWVYENQTLSQIGRAHV